MKTTCQTENQTHSKERELIADTLLLDIMETYQPKRTNLLRQKGLLASFLKEVSKKITWNVLFESKDAINKCVENRNEIIETIVKQNRQVLGFYGIV